MKSTEILKTRDELSNNISKYWNIINVENVVNRNYKRNYNLKELYDSIIIMCSDRALFKLKALCINMGIFNFKDLATDSIQLDIFMLAELKEIKIRLGKIRTLNPKLKKKKGKNNLNKTEVLTSDWIKARKNELDLQINELEKKISSFNESHELNEEKAPMKLIA